MRGKWECVTRTRNFGRERKLTGEFAAILAQDRGPDAPREEEIRSRNSPLIGAMAYFLGKYGSRVQATVLQYLHGHPVPLVVYAEHKLIARDENGSLSPAGSYPAKGRGQVQAWGPRRSYLTDTGQRR